MKAALLGRLLSLEWQGGGGFDFLHAEKGCDVEDFDLRDQGLVEEVIGTGVFDADFEQVVDIAGEAVGFEDFGAGAQDL